MQHTALKKLNGIGRITVAVLIVCLAACDRTDEIEPSGNVYKIAYVNSDENIHIEKDDALSGVLAANFAAPLLDNGDRLEIVYQDQAETKMDIVHAMRQNIEQHDVSATLLGSNSKHILQNKLDIDALGVPTIAIVATHPDVVSDVKYISQLSFDDELQGQVAALFVRDELLVQRAAIFFDGKDPYSSYLAQIFRTQFEQTGGLVTGFNLVSELNQTMLESLEARRTQIIYMPMSAKQVLDAVATLNLIAWSPILMGADGLYARLAQEFPDRLYEVNNMFVTDVYTDPGEFVSMAKFVSRVLGYYEKMFNDETTTDTGLGVEAYRVIKQAMNQCVNRNDGECINRKIRSTENQQGIISKFSILKNGKAKRPVYINKIKNDELRMVVKVN